MRHATQFPPAGHTPSSMHQGPATFGAADNDVTGEFRLEPDFVAIAESEEFWELRCRLRAFVFPMSALFLVWYLTYVVVAAYEPGFMSIRVVGEINIGLLMGLGQFVSTIAITVLYLRFATRRIDPLVRELRQAVLGGDLG
jgi:uncharacterized membrane protein (DUF485 family)